MSPEGGGYQTNGFTADSSNDFLSNLSTISLLTHITYAQWHATHDNLTRSAATAAEEAGRYKQAYNEACKKNLQLEIEVENLRALVENLRANCFTLQQVNDKHKAMKLRSDADAEHGNVRVSPRLIKASKLLEY